ncbi:UNKNOWN [Stylonychia lemnae]|uniref:N-acetyltransferase domain-containing protein n=1 Tax=Stylonychia lemnae TaxID=5949 RepID=A0A077ZWT6_STYLE|nr:UNKNOWN [Stylonychia lemnae]|eukprot:CDW74376.1 UNKNOWN [Stylonychia lemnae]
MEYQHKDQLYQRNLKHDDQLKGILFQQDAYIFRYPVSDDEFDREFISIISSKYDDPIPGSLQLDSEIEGQLNNHFREVFLKENALILIENKENNAIVGWFTVLDQDASFLESFKRANDMYQDYFKPESKKLRVRLILIKKEYRGQGLSRYLFPAIDTIAKNFGFESIQMLTAAPEMFKLCEKHGYNNLAELFEDEMPNEYLEVLKPSDEIKTRLRGQPFRVIYYVKNI